MGLPLFIAPVESDITSKPSTKSSADPAHARSPIRRSERRRQLHETREHRLRLLAALQANDDSLTQPESTGRASGTASPSTDALRSSRHSPSAYDDILGLVRDHRDRRDRREALRSRPPHPDTNIQHEESFLRADGPEPRYVTWSNESTPDLASTNWGQVVNLSNGGSLLYRSRLREANASSANSPALYTVQPHDYPPSASRLTQRLRESNSSGAGTRASRSQVPDPGEYLDEYRRRRRDAQSDAPRVSSRPRAWRSVRYVDGLGDRDRSLSPEDSNVWDTLQSTLTPDPQPPSVGSSFASTTASVGTSQTTASSANTSVTHPDETAELPCEPVADHSESDGEDEEHRTGPSRRTIALSSRSYADVVALPPARGGPERLEWLSDMQRIVQGLASRQDIPDQWWAAAGLSRSFVMGDDSI
ncbi:hypothetical protein PG997_004382 [Apiospora hydei]|uniref:Uncharacterized protein n=1 Tax=Apiospora hydei TaxID=1337664 RepID=A0ABR1X1X3_9PEZI